MITNTIGGTIYSTIGVGKIADYNAKPVKYMHDLQDTVVQQNHTEQLAAKSRDEVEAGLEFADKVANLSYWYTPPKGHIIDEMA
jgi:hypothetical protein